MWYEHSKFFVLAGDLNDQLHSNHWNTVCVYVNVVVSVCLIIKK